MWFKNRFEITTSSTYHSNNYDDDDDNDDNDDDDADLIEARLIPLVLKCRNY